MAVIDPDSVENADKRAEKTPESCLIGQLPGSKGAEKDKFWANPGILRLLFSESVVWITDSIDRICNFASIDH